MRERGTELYKGLEEECSKKTMKNNIRKSEWKRKIYFKNFFDRKVTKPWFAKKENDSGNLGTHKDQWS